MGAYIIKRLFLIIPTLFLILLINFVVVQIAPGGPVEQAIQQAESFSGVKPGRNCFCQYRYPLSGCAWSDARNGRKN